MNNRTNILKAPILLGVAVSAALVGAWIASAGPDPSEQPWGYLAPIELSDRDLEGDFSQGFRTWFENGQFQGDLVEYTVAPNGTLSTSIDLSGSSPVNTDPFDNWSAAVRFAARETADSAWWDASTDPANSRKIITRVNFTQTPFQWTNLTTELKQAIDSGAAASASSDVLNFIRGDRSREASNGGPLRNRLGVLGSIVHSNPVYVAEPDSDFSSASYFSFASANATRAPRVYVGANDGMVHAFDAETGDEKWAYIPSVLLKDLDLLATPSYRHRYFADGGLTTADVEITTDIWRTLLGGGLGAGGKGIFILDITSADLATESSTGGLYTENRKLFGELTPDFDDDLGHVYGRPIFAQLNNGDWYMVHGNGYNSVNGEAKLYLINLRTGSVTRLATDTTTENGLSGPALVDTNSDGKIDLAYAGDLQGRMWKFDLPVNDSGTLNPSNGSLLIDTGLSITSTPDVARHSLYGFMVYFATGRLLTPADEADATTINAAYGIWDKPGTPGNGGLYTVNMSADLTYVDETLRTLLTPATPIDWEGDDANIGWILPFNAGDRVVTPVQVRAGRVKMVTMNPVTFENWVLEPNIENGGPYLYPVFDINVDGALNIGDRIDQNNNGVVTDPSDVPMGWKMPTGLVSRLTIARIGRARDTAFYNNLTLPDYSEPCIGACEGGIIGGHFDLDTDGRRGHGNGFANDTTKHDHEYDDKYNTTEANYFNAPSHPKLQDAFSNQYNKEFIVLMANADLSPGGLITIGSKSWNVLEYQIMLHKKLRDWDGTGDLLDDDGDSLTFTVNEILGRNTSGNPINGAIPGAVRTSFYADAISRGGLIPTETGCVKKVQSMFGIDDRWRGGALHMQVITKDELVAAIPNNGIALDALYVQNPSDPRLWSDPVVYDNISFPMTDSHPKYPKFGGMRVPGSPTSSSDPAMFRYESTLFWHWDNKSCFGDSKWISEIEKIRGLTLEKFEEMTGFTLDEYLAIDGDSFSKCKKIRTGETKKGVAGCKTEYNNWRAAGELANYVGNQGSTGELILGDGFDARTGAGLTTGTLTPPPKGYASDYEYGRQGWSDVIRD